MAKKLSIKQIEARLLKLIDEAESLFPMEMNISLVGRDPNNSACEFVMGRDSLDEVAASVKRTIKREQATNDE